MRALFILTLMGLGCGATPAPPPAQQPVIPNRPFPPVPVSIEPEPGGPPQAEPEPDLGPGPIGAMPVPAEDPPLAGDSFFANPPLETMDTTVYDSELPRESLRWKKRVHVDRSGRVMVVLRIDRWNDGGIYLSIVEDGTGIHEQYKLGESDDTVANPIDGTAFRPWGPLDEISQPILFAVRIHPRGAKRQHQFVVYKREESLLVVQRPLGATVWKRTLRLDFDFPVTFQPIGTSDPH